MCTGVVNVKRWLLCFVLMVALIGCGSFKFVEAANWVWMYSSDYATISVDAASCTRYNGIVYFWDQWEYIDSPERDELIEGLNQDRRNRGDYEIDFSDLRKITHRICTYKGRDGADYTQFLKICYYDSSGHVIDSYSYVLSKYEWDIVSPETIAEIKVEAANYYAH